MPTYTDLRMAFLKLRLAHTPVITHASLGAFGEVVGGAETLLNATIDSVWALIMPTFTYRTMITPGIGPANNALDYGGPPDGDIPPEPFVPDMPADPEIGVTSEALRLHPHTRRSSHPILSFAGLNADKFLSAQTLGEPLGVIAALAAADAWVLLLGVDHTTNTSIHYGERLAGRRQFLRWALLPDRVVECPQFPGDSAGFEAFAADLDPVTRHANVGAALVRAMPIRSVLDKVVERVKADPYALLCSRPECKRCNAVRESVRLTTAV